ncbi:hypothetical protein LZ480_05465 [Solibacillus sp. MA9]|uniref:Phosphatase n=1 Tax=Solibacillus palustris TaxID=2908203 RepID=A0ABS9UAH7_9BACL|nr:hypothetical protein [Solibacillus sp. MA9]MCH7321335.1 hypothetical protein [Solibacillus sp. MA9]
MKKKRILFNLLFVFGIGLSLLQFTSSAHAENELPPIGVKNIVIPQENTYSPKDF